MTISTILQPLITRSGLVETAAMRQTRTNILTDKASIAELKAAIREYVITIEVSVNKHGNATRPQALVGQMLTMLVLYDELMITYVSEEFVDLQRAFDEGLVDCMDYVYDMQFEEAQNNFYPDVLEVMKSFVY